MLVIYLVNFHTFFPGIRQEVRAQTNLAELYKKQAEDEEEKSIKLSEAITELQGILKQKDNIIQALEYDLVLANKMLEGWNLLQEGVRRLFYCAMVRNF